MTKPYKLSYYTIFTEPFNDRGQRVLFSTRTGKTLVVPPLCYDFLQNDACEAIPEPVLTRLRDIQAVVPRDEDELAGIVAENERAIDSEKTDTLYEVIQPAAMCQLGCYYCGQQHTKDYLDRALMDAVVARVREKASRGTFRRLYIGWFGAEPLMALRQIRELSAEFKALAAERGMTYGAKVVTNGLSLKEGVFQELVREMNVDAIEVTLDGTAEFHDRHRYTKEGGASFDLIFKNLRDILLRDDFPALNCRVTIRCNVDESNVAGVSPLIRLLAEHGLHRRIGYFYPVGVYAWGNDAHKKSLTKEEFARREIGWQVEMMRLGYPFSGLLPTRVRKVCMAVSQHSEMYDAFGNRFNCTEVSYVPQYVGTPYVLGNLKKPDAPEPAQRPLADWNQTLLTDRFPCHTCKMLPVCGGGCPKSWHEDMRACPTPKFNIRDRLLLTYALNKNGEADVDAKLDEFERLHAFARGGEAVEA